MSSLSGDLRLCQSDQTWGWPSSVWKQVGDALYPTDSANPNLSVGIGTTGPATKLAVAGTANSHGVFVTNNIAGNVQTMLMVGDSSIGAYIAGATNPDGTTSRANDFGGRIILQGASSGGIQVQTSAVASGAHSWGTRMYIGHNGNVGIGTPAPRTNLDVKGNNTSAGGDYFIVGSSTADFFAVKSSTIWALGATVHSSDARQKKNIQQVTNALDRLLHINGVTWQWRDASLGQEEQMGVVAQDVERVAPQLVQEHGGYKAVHYDGLHALTIEAIKEQQAQLEQQRTQIERLQHELETLKDKIP